MSKGRKHKLRREVQWFSFLIPALFFYLAFFILPAASSVYFSLTDWNGLTSHFIGLQNFVRLFQDKMIRTTLGNTAMYAIGITVIQNVLGMILAVFMNRALKGVGVLRAMFFMPYIFSSLLIGYVWGFILEPNIGVVNNLLAALHLGMLQADWLGNPLYSRWMIILVTVWQCVGYSMVIYVAGLNAIPSDLYESCDIDGAKGFTRFRRVTFPMIAPAFTVNIMLSLIGSLQLFNQIYALTNGGPGYATNSVATMIYNVGFRSGSQWGYGTAMSVTLFAVILLITAVAVPLLRKREVEM